MGCTMSRQSTKNSRSNSTSVSSLEPRYSTSSSASSSCKYTDNTFCSSTFSPVSSSTLSPVSSSVTRPERAYSPVASSYTPYHQRKHPTVLIVDEKEMKAKKAAEWKQPSIPKRSGDEKDSQIPPLPTIMPKITKLSKQKLDKIMVDKKVKKSSKISKTAESEPKFEISWPTSCHRNPGLLPSAIALGYPYPYPFPLSSVPSDPDLVATATNTRTITTSNEEDQQRGRAGKPELLRGDIAAGCYGYDEEGVMNGAVKLEIKPGRNGKWENAGLADLEERCTRGQQGEVERGRSLRRHSALIATAR